MGSLSKRLTKKLEKQDAKEQEALDQKRTDRTSPVVRDLFKSLAKHEDKMLFAEDFVRYGDKANEVCNLIAEDLLKSIEANKLPISDIEYIYQLFLQIPYAVKNKVETSIDLSMDAFLEYIFEIEGLNKEYEITIDDLNKIKAKYSGIKKDLVAGKDK